MKILVCSDSHGNVDNMVRAVERSQPQLVIHLGDGWRDAEKLARLFPDLPVEQVPGNCDLRPGTPGERVLCLEDRRILLCHGHAYGVKQSLLPLALAAEEQRVDAVLFGHTHRALYDRRGELTILNPGSIGDYVQPSYGVLWLRREGITADLLRL